LGFFLVGVVPGRAVGKVVPVFLRFKVIKFLVVEEAVFASMGFPHCFINKASLDDNEGATIYSGLRDPFRLCAYGRVVAIQRPGIDNAKNPFFLSSGTGIRKISFCDHVAKQQNSCFRRCADQALCSYGFGVVRVSNILRGRLTAISISKKKSGLLPGFQWPD